MTTHILLFLSHHAVRHRLRYFILIGLLVAGGEIQGSPSLAAEHQIDEIPVTINGVKESFSVVQDAFDDYQWYYIPDQPRLFERTIDGKTEPEFALIRYQFKKPSEPNKLLERGLLQFATRLAIPSQAIGQLSQVIAQKKGVSAQKIRLSALPLKSATVALYTPDDGNILAYAPLGAGIAPNHATQKMVFSVPLTKIGADVYNELVTGNTGLGIAVTMSYSGVTPPAGFKVIVDWERTYSFFSKHSKFRAQAALYGGLTGRALLSASYQLDRQKLREALLQNKAIKVEVIEGEDMSQIDNYLQPILNRINQEILEAFKLPEKFALASTSNPSISGRWFGFGYSVAVKDFKDVKKGKEIIDFSIRKHQERRTIASGFIGIGRYPTELRDRLVTVVEPGGWQSAFFVLPAVADELGISQVDMQIALFHQGQRYDAQSVKWTPAAGWRDRNHVSRTVVAFPLVYWYQKMGYSAMKQVKFESNTLITLGRKVLKLRQRVDMFDGDTPIATPLSAVEVVEIDGQDLNWRLVKDDGTLSRVSVALKSGDQEFQKTLRARNVDGEWLPPKPVYWLLPRAAPKPIEAKIRYRYKHRHKKVIDWAYNGQDIRAEFPDLSIYLEDED
ncbi:hypothetical protein PN36_10465 [Candidatus Thiomargarita nelsonii]|uniref:Uncharacterized protein n=1 Tax=Candidatus Thiomargarita nelsonii TaxID=1003181 RepID=A0A0A6PKJ6_9GAMM|nr:hypothetical protein PN36_10465 [Candidatus Thiomargarita nelsonii]